MQDVHPKNGVNMGSKKCREGDTQSSPLPEQLGIIEMLTKLQILKWLSNPNGSWQLLETQDSDR